MSTRIALRSTSDTDQLSARASGAESRVADSVAGRVMDISLFRRDHS